MNATQEAYLVRDLLKTIYAKQRAMYLDYGKTDERWYVSYSASTPWPRKRVLLHYEESTLEMAVLKTYRFLALHRQQWETFAEEQL